MSGRTKPALQVQVKPAKGMKAEKLRVEALSVIGRDLDKVMALKDSMDRVKGLFGILARYEKHGFSSCAARIRKAIASQFHDE